MGLTWQNIVSVARQLDKLEKIIKELSNKDDLAKCGSSFYNQGLSINRASILFFMGANIQIKYEIALSRVHF